MTNIATAKKLIAATSMEGARILSAGLHQGCSPLRYNQAATAALADPEAHLTWDERSLIAQFVENDESGHDFMLRVRMTYADRDRLQQDADAETGGNISELVRRRCGLVWVGKYERNDE